VDCNLHCLQRVVVVSAVVSGFEPLPFRMQEVTCKGSYCSIIILELKTIFGDSGTGSASNPGFVIQIPFQFVIVGRTLPAGR
jgi:hypothetical protein